MNYFSTKPKIIRSYIVDTEEKLNFLITRLSKVTEFALDTETNELNKIRGYYSKFRLVGISISWGAYNNYYIPVTHIRKEDEGRALPIKLIVEKLQPIFENENLRLILMNATYDLNVLLRVGIRVYAKEIFDVMIASWLCDDANLHNLKYLSKRFLKIQQATFENTLQTIPKYLRVDLGLKRTDKITADLTLIDDLAPYAVDDAFCTWELYKGFLLWLTEEKFDKMYFRVYSPFIATIMHMEEQGVTVDIEQLNRLEELMIADLTLMRAKLVELAGTDIDPDKNEQLQALLYGYRKEGSKLPDDLVQKSFKFAVEFKTATGKPSTDKIAIHQLAIKDARTAIHKTGVSFCKVLLEYRRIKQLQSTFITGLKAQIYDDGKIHTDYKICGAVTGRLSSANPNLQNLPKAEDDARYKIRELFIGSIDSVTGKRKKIIAVDYKNLEMMVLAHFSGDRTLLKLINSGGDVHSQTAIDMFDLTCKQSEVKKTYPHIRQIAKTLNFLLGYGGGALLLYMKLKTDFYNPLDLGGTEYLQKYRVRSGKEVARKLIEKYFVTYCGVADFIQRQKQKAHKNGYVTTLFGRKRRLVNLNSDNKSLMGKDERNAVNGCIQASAADIMVMAQNRIDNDTWFREHRAYMIMQVHDEVVVECPEEFTDECIKRVQYHMEHAVDEIKIKLKVKLVADCSGAADSYQGAK